MYDKFLHIYLQIILASKDGVLKNHHVKSPLYQKLCKAIAHGDSAERIAKILYKDDNHQACFEQIVAQKLHAETGKLGSKNGSSELVKKDADSLINIDPSPIFKEWDKASPLFYQMLKALLCKEEDNLKKDEEIKLLSLGSMCLFNRNPTMSRIQIGFGLMLDEAGVTDEAIKLTNAAGFTPSPSTVGRRKKLLIKKTQSDKEMHFTKIKNTVGCKSAVKALEQKQLPRNAMLSLPEVLSVEHPASSASGM